MQIYLQKGRNFIKTVSRNTGISVPRRKLGGTSPSTKPKRGMGYTSKGKQLKAKEKIKKNVHEFA